ncbi:unnamed protein product [Lactuca virosa]|uniref:Uncharacterized protein n=1 Tax=Lactuca virosa TaxID=75947 RepID=A0AAU9PGD8_9ASTR|nr:unnamed protein product [Lactuca virosa]
MSNVRALWQASLTCTKRALSWNVNDMFPLSERFIYNFNSKEELKKWHLYSVSEYGELEITDAGNQQSGDNTGVFSGNLSQDVTDSTKWNISRRGFCGMRPLRYRSTKNQRIWEELYIYYLHRKLSEFSWTNGKKFMASFCIPLAHYLRTWRWNVIEVDIEINPSRVVGIVFFVNAEGGVPGGQTGPGVDVFLSGYVFHLKILHERDLGLLNGQSESYQVKRVSSKVARKELRKLKLVSRFSVKN